MNIFEIKTKDNLIDYCREQGISENIVCSHCKLYELDICNAGHGRDTPFEKLIIYQRKAKLEKLLK